MNTHPPIQAIPRRRPVQGLGSTAWFLLNDRLKLLAYRVFDPTKAALLTKKPVDLRQRIATRAYELYEQRGRRDGQAGRDWLEAEREIRKDEPHK
jgi:H+-transporting ATPase